MKNIFLSRERPMPMPNKHVLFFKDQLVGIGRADGVAKDLVVAL